MKESYGEGIANHTGSESCGHGRKARREALTGETGRISREIPQTPRRRRLDTRRKDTSGNSVARAVPESCAVFDPGTRGHILRGVGRSRVHPSTPTRVASGGPRTQADDERTWEVGQTHSAWEVFEQSQNIGGGGDGGKGSGQDEAADSSLAGLRHISIILIPRAVCALLPEARAVWGKPARTDPCGWYGAICIPTATWLKPVRSTERFSQCPDFRIP
jgi:hypothetical protein